MVKMKQTAHGGKSRQEGMQVAMFGNKPEEGQFIEVPAMRTRKIGQI